MSSNPSAAPVNATSIGGVAISGTAAANKVIDGTGAAAAAWTTYLDATATDITADGTQAAGAVGQAADAGHVHPGASWLPADNGLLAANFALAAAGGAGALTSGVLYCYKLIARQAQTWSTLWFLLSTAGTGTDTGSFAGLYSADGQTLFSGSASIAGQLKGTLGPISVNLTTPKAVTAGTAYYAVLLENLGGTQPQLRAGSAGTTAPPQLNLAASALASGTVLSGQTSLPSSFTPGSMAAAAQAWVGAS